MQEIGNFMGLYGLEVAAGVTISWVALLIVYNVLLALPTAESLI
jgi:hypothetical protein